MNTTSTAPHPMRILGVFAHPDDETFCAGGTFATYVAGGAEVMVVSATRGEAGQIRSAGVATRRTLGQVREQELYLACRRLGVQHAMCLDYGDGRLQEGDQDILIGKISEIICSFQPDVVITFGPDGGYGHPDHIAVCAATTAACERSGDGHCSVLDQLSGGSALQQASQLFYCCFPQKQQLLLEQLANWLVQATPPFQGTSEFAYELTLLCEEATLLHFACDHVDITWYPAGVSILEQGERVNGLYLLLSGTAQVVRENFDGTGQVLADLTPGSFFGAEELVNRQACLAHVIAEQNVTCLVLTAAAPTAFLRRGAETESSTSLGGEERGMDQVLGDATCINVTPYLRKKLEAISAHRSQFPIQPNLLPSAILQQLMGQEYFVPASSISRLTPDASDRSDAMSRQEVLKVLAVPEAFALSGQGVTTVL